MPRPKKDYQILNVKLDSTIMERFKKYCSIMGQTRTTALERILQKQLDSFEQIIKEDRVMSSSEISISNALDSFSTDYMKDNLPKANAFIRKE